jgi:hypothetical protein
MVLIISYHIFYILIPFNLDLMKYLGSYNTKKFSINKCAYRINVQKCVLYYGCK